jgi:hypothetical protein
LGSVYIIIPHGWHYKRRLVRINMLVDERKGGRQGTIALVHCLPTIDDVTKSRTYQFCICIHNARMPSPGCQWKPPATLCGVLLPFQGKSEPPPSSLSLSLSLSLSVCLSPRVPLAFSPHVQVLRVNLSLFITDRCTGSRSYGGDADTPRGDSCPCGGGRVPGDKRVSGAPPGSGPPHDPRPAQRRFHTKSVHRAGLPAVYRLLCRCRVPPQREGLAVRP